MGIKYKTNYYDLINIVKKTNNPFARENYVGEIKQKLGKGFFLWHDLGNGIATEVWNYTLEQDTIATITAGIPGAVVIFNLANSFTYTFKDNKKYLLKENTIFIGFASEDFSVEMDLKKDTYYSTFTIGVKEELFLNLSNNLKYMNKKMKEAKNNSYAILEGWEIDPKQLEILSSFKKEQLNDNLLTDLHLESKTTDLLHYTIEKMIRMIDPISSLNLKIDENKIKSLKRAKEIILTEYANSLSIKEIAYKSAINECYLKKYFKEYYGMTIHEMLQEHRLKIAKDLLQQDISVKEVALKVGYKHTGHFSKLFFKYFSTTPSVYKKQFSKY